MAEHDQRDEDVSRRYRELEAEEPPPALDAAIRAHARRAVEARSTRPWYFSLAAAAVLVLAVALTWNVEREAPDMVAVAPPPPPVVASEPAPATTMSAPATPAPQPAPRAERRERAEPKAEEPAETPAVAGPGSGARDTAELARQQAPASAPAPAVRADEARPQVGAAARSEMMAKRAFSETPEQWLERIARLRAEGKHDEADKALAEFRQRHPDFKIPEETLKKVER